MTSRGLEKERMKRIVAEITGELENTQRVVSETEQAKQKFTSKEPVSLELRGLASLLLDFYNGVESIFAIIAQELNGGIPAGQEWHKQLLKDMTIKIDDLRPAVIDTSIGEELDEYLRFRHLFIHSYGFSLKWERVRFLLDKLATVFKQFQQQTEIFLEFVRSL